MGWDLHGGLVGDGNYVGRRDRRAREGAAGLGWGDQGP